MPVLRCFILGFAFIAAHVLGSTPVWAQSAAHSAVSPADALGNVIVCPDRPTPVPASVMTVTVRSAPGVVMPFTPVWLVFSPSADVSFCSSMVLSGSTNAAGDCTFVMAGGGYGGTASDVEIWAGPGAGVLLRTFPVKSPDFDGGGGNLSVDLADLQLFASQFGTGATSHDYGPPTGVDLGDLIIFAAAFLLPSSCN